jgi:hypothetical protein
LHFPDILIKGILHMRYFFINETTPQEIRAALSPYGTCVPLPEFKALPHPVCRHPDMLMASINGNIFVHREYQKGQALLRDLGIPFLISQNTVKNTYPHDVALNCFDAGGYLFAKASAVSEEVLAKARESEMPVLSVSQGYTKCSSAVIKNAIATADKGIARAAQSVGIPALLLPPHKIGIEVYDTGFIGGASVVLNENTLGFFGKIENYPSYEALKQFFSTVGVEILSLSEKPLFDYGGAVTVERT